MGISNDIKIYEITVRAVFTGELRTFSVAACDAYHASRQARELAKRDLIVRIRHAPAG